MPSRNKVKGLTSNAANAVLPLDKELALNATIRVCVSLKRHICRLSTSVCVYLKCRQRRPATRVVGRQRRSATSVGVSLKYCQRRPAIQECFQCQHDALHVS